jgi:MFS family permease
VSTPDHLAKSPQEKAAKKAHKARRQRLATTSIALSVFVCWLGSTAFMSSGRQVADSVTASHVDISLALNSYAIALILVCVAGGRIADVYDRKAVFLWSAGVFAAVGLVSPFVNSLLGLFALRALMGAAAGLILSSTGGILVTTMHGDERHNAWLWWRGAGMAGVVMGPVLGPLIATTLTWRWVEPLSSLAMVCALALGARNMKKSHDKQSAFSPMMIAPTVLLGVGLLAPYLVIVLAHDSIGNVALWSAVTVMGLVSITGFIVLNRRFVNPLFAENIASHNPRLWLTDTFSALHICSLFVALAAYSIAVEVGAGLDAGQTAVVMLLMAVPTIGFHLSAHHVRNTWMMTRQKQTALGCLLLIASVVLFYVLNRDAITVWTMAPTLVLAGSGFGMLRLFGHMGVIKTTGSRWAATLFGARTFGNHSGTAIGGVIVGVVLASNSAAFAVADPNVAYQAVLVANISIVAVVLVTGVFVLLKHQILGFDDVHWHAGEPDIVEGDSADAQSA